MKATLLRELEEKTHAPRGIAALIAVEDLRQLLEERAALLRVCQRTDLRLRLERGSENLLHHVERAIAKAEQP